MKIYLVGGAVRDKLLGLPVKEKDWVVVGATVNDMINKGFRQVGKEFPVFLHPKTHEEYALARKERKVEPGYKGFDFDTAPTVSLEDDLMRRDLTINAMAETPDGKLIDPYQGQKDLELKLLRHVSPAFAEDPVRILRIGRFLARFADKGFSIAPETRQLMQQMVKAGEVDALVAERVWKELERALGEPHPEKFFEALAACDAIEILFPQLLRNETGIKALMAASCLDKDTSVRFAALLHDLPEPKTTIAKLCRRYRAPAAYKELALLTAGLFETAIHSKQLNAEDLLHLFAKLDTYRRDKRFLQFLVCCQAIAKARDIQFDADWLLACAQASKHIDIKALMTKGLTGQKLAEKIKKERLARISAFLAENSLL